jgi:ribonuclease HI
MSDPSALTIYTDGAARGNPGPAAFAYIIQRDGQPDIEVKECLGQATNNVAEYTALLRALDHARALGGRRLTIFSDSELLVKQMNGEYQVKHEGLRPLYAEAVRLRRNFDAVTIRHLRREENRRADQLCNEALDGKGPGAARVKGKLKKAVTDKREESVKEELLESLRSIAAAWARGNPDDPKPEDVLQQLWSVLEENGVLRKRK